MEDVEDLNGFPAMLSALAEGERTASPDVGRETAAYLRARAIVAAGSDAEASLEPAFDHPGYLTRQVSGRDIFVPFNLASVFPGSEMLREVMEIADTISLRPQDPVCISGSTTFLGAIDRIGDLDFCEYYVADPAGMAADALAVSAHDDLPLAWLKCGGHDLKAPWMERRPEVEALLRGLPDKRIKLDFVSNGPLGLLPTTSVVIATGDEDVAARHSFAYQEAVVTGVAPTRTLVSPERFGEYLNWLRAEIRRLATPTGLRDGYAIKALKRALSLMLIAGHDEGVADVIDRLRRSELSTIVLQVRVEELERMLGDLPEGLPDRFAAALNELRDEIEEVTSHEVDEALDAARELAMASLDLVEAEFAAYG